MSKNTNDGLDDIGCFIDVPLWQQLTSSVEQAKTFHKQSKLLVRH